MDNRALLEDVRAAHGQGNEAELMKRMVGVGYAVKLDRYNVAKGIVSYVSSPQEYYVNGPWMTLVDPAQYMPQLPNAGLIGRFSMDDLFATRKEALEARDPQCKRKHKTCKPDKRGWTQHEHGVLRQLLELPCPIKSLLCQDMYKYSMAQFMLHRYPRCVIRVEFKNRGQEKLGYLHQVIDKWLDELCALRYQDCEIQWLETHVDWLTSDFIGFLRRFYLFRDQIHVGVANGGDLEMWTEAPFIDCTWFEVMCLALVAEAHATFRLLLLGKEEAAKRRQAAMERVHVRAEWFDKLYKTHPFTLSEFGLRRRACAELEETVVRVFSGHGRDTWFAGTSNLELARTYNVRPSGTMAHELYMAMQGVGIAMADVQRQVWTQWMDEFNGRNGILLTDPFGAMSCMKKLTPHIAKAFDGFRHDSGDPVVWGELMMERLSSMGVDPATKTFVWSDNLDFETLRMLVHRFSRRVKVAFGVGTWLVHDLDGIAPSNIVMKLTQSNGRPVLKVPDSVGKGSTIPKWLFDEAVRENGIEPMPVGDKWK